MAVGTVTAAILQGCWDTESTQVSTAMVPACGRAVCEGCLSGTSTEATEVVPAAASPHLCQQRGMGLHQDAVHLTELAPDQRAARPGNVADVVQPQVVKDQQVPVPSL